MYISVYLGHSVLRLTLEEEEIACSYLFIPCILAFIHVSICTNVRYVSPPISTATMFLIYYTN